jgi:quinoprotein glucose dehydrogenase
MKSLTLLVLLAVALAAPGAEPYQGWPQFGGSDNIHYSRLKQITPQNVAKLQTAWTFDTGDAFDRGEMQCNPIVVDGVLYATSPKLRVFALDAATGKKLWDFFPLAPDASFSGLRNRGLNYWTDGKQARILFAARQWLYSLDAKTGRPDPAFAENGRIDLRQGFDRPADGLSVSITSPGVVYRDLFITGSIVSEALPAAPGDIRAFDVRTGKLRWTFHTIPRPGEMGHETWPKDAWKHTGGVNSWPGLTLDEKRGLVYVPTGSAAFDFYGADRHGDNLFANCVLALKAETGERVWHFQAVKHDVWDRDFPAAPALVTVRRNGKLVDAVAQIAKSGHVWLLDRDTGKPLFPVEERKVPASPVPGEKLAETQILPVLPEPFSRQRLTEEMLTRRTPEAHAAVLERFRKIRSNGQWEPPSAEGTIVFPGFDGGGEWGGAAFDPATRILYVNANEMAWILRLVPRPKQGGRIGGRRLYQSHCAACHGDSMAGSPPSFPSLLDAREKYDQAKFIELLKNGVGRMPGFSRLGQGSLEAITAFVRNRDDQEVVDHRAADNAPGQLAYTFDGYNKFLDPDGYPAIAPPWGTLNAIHLDTGKILWKIPFGEHPKLADKTTGSENYGGPIVTENGLLLIAATNLDRKFRAFDKRNGKLLFETELPFSGNATPAMYEAGGRQFIVFACGGGKSGAPSGGLYVAYALPKP